MIRLTLFPLGDLVHSYRQTSKSFNQLRNNGLSHIPKSESFDILPDILARFNQKKQRTKDETTDYVTYIPTL